MITHPDENILPHLKRIWQTCFLDSEKYTSFVFEKLMSARQMLVKLDDDARPVSMLSWKPLRFMAPGLDFIGAYIFGVATLPEYRGKGISTALMDDLHRILIEEGAALSCLVPASPSLFEFYVHRGFETHFYYKKIAIEGSAVPEAVGGELTPARFADLEDLRTAAFGESSLFGCWDSAYLDYLDEECRRCFGGEVLRFSGSGRDGCVVCYPRPEGAVLVKEAAVHREDIGALLSALHRRYSARRYIIRLPEDHPPEDLSGEILPFAMVKWYDKEKKALAVSSLGSAPWFAFGLD